MEVWLNSEHYDCKKHQLFDCRNVMDNVEDSLYLFNKSHIRHAVFVSGYPLLYDKDRPEEGRHPLPDLTQFYSFVTEQSEGKTTVCYDDHEGFMAARFFFLCTLVGLPCLIIREGYEQMTLPKETSCLSAEDYFSAIEMLEHIEPESIRSELIASRAEVREATGILIDAREEQRYLGEIEPIDRIPGRIPGAVNIHYKKVLHSEDGLEELDKTVQGHTAIVYCGSGLSASPLFAALTSLGHMVKLYPGSYSEWIFHHADDIERG
jgi:thiosulfate/3-mercaptopyruvate sulfurtransferase